MSSGTDNSPDQPAYVTDKIQALKQEYYEGNAKIFDEHHIQPDDEHYISLKYISAYIGMLKIDSVLDIGAGTGRGILYMNRNHPEVRAEGIEPSPDMRARAIAKGVGENMIHLGRGEKLPFPDKSFDAVTEFGVVHHIQDRDAAIKEMMRVSRKAIFLSDGNRYGSGSTLSKLIKLAAWKTGLWPLLNLLNTRGKGYVFSDSDGLAYSYSPYDQLHLLADWADRINVIPTGPEKPTKQFLHPLFTSSIVLFAALKSDELITKNPS